MDRASLLSFHQKLGDGSATFILPEITLVQQVGLFPGSLPTQTECEDKVSHQVGQTDLTLTQSKSEQWSENGFLCERDLRVQEDLEWLAEAVYQFYRKHLDKLIRENDRMWGDFCKKSYGDDGNETGLDQNTYGYDMTDPNAEVPTNKKTAIPDPETHIFSQRS